MLDNKIIQKYPFLKKTKGQVGIEIEMEMEVPLKVSGGFPTLWNIENDSSLKVNGIELVSKKPIEIASVESCIKVLRTHLSHTKQLIRPSIRAGVHIHLNVQQFTTRQLYILMACYYLMETPLTKFCGDGREDNLFCLTMKDTPYISTKLEKSLQNGSLDYLQTDDLRYSALNFQSLFKFGSVEFRALATDTKLERISPWVSLLSRLMEYSLLVDDPWEELLSTSGMGGREWLKGVFGEELFKLIDYEGIDIDVQEDAQNVQHLIYKMKEAGV